jgi:hypothetical protein
VSTIPAAIAALVTLVEATVDTVAWQITDGPPDTEAQRAQRLISVGDDEIASPTDFDSMAAQGMAERYMIPMTVSVALPGPESLIVCRTEALAAHEAIREAVLATPSLGLVAQGVLSAFPTSERRIQQFATPEGRSAAIRFGIDIYAQLI